MRGGRCLYVSGLVCLSLRPPQRRRLRQPPGPHLEGGWFLHVEGVGGVQCVCDSLSLSVCPSISHVTS